VLALPASWGQDVPKKDEKKPPSAKEQYAALLKDFSAQQREIITEAQKAKGEEQQKIIQKYRGLGTDFAEKFYKLAEDNPKDPVAADALAWVVQNDTGGPLHQKAVDRLVEKYPDHDALERVCQSLGRGRSPDAAATLKKILGKATKPRVKAAAALALGRSLSDRIDSLGDKPAEADKVAAEAEKYFTQVIDLGKDNEAVKKDAERLLNALRTLRVGKEAPDIKGADLDGKEFKLTDYRGKVVLLDFWGNW
jgi:vacuolar-type H+-ATPase subunit H